MKTIEQILGMIFIAAGIVGFLWFINLIVGLST